MRGRHADRPFRDPAEILEEASAELEAYAAQQEAGVA